MFWTGEAKQQYEELKPKFDELCRQYSEMEAELQERIVKPLTQRQSTSKHPGLDAVIASAAERRQRQNGVAMSHENMDR